MTKFLASQKAPSAKRCIKTTRLDMRRTPLAGVRKHRAPNYALRPTSRSGKVRRKPVVRKHRAPNGALRQVLPQRSVVDVVPSQKAPSAKWCIKTKHTMTTAEMPRHRQKVPSAKRCIKTCDSLIMAIARDSVRKHQEPKGALRRRDFMMRSHSALSQKAPSAKRCIKTCDRHRAKPFRY